MLSRGSNKKMEGLHTNYTKKGEMSKIQTFFFKKKQAKKQGRLIFFFKF